MSKNQPKFEDCLNHENSVIFNSFKTPYQIQEFLDSIPYVGEELNRSPLLVMQDRQCHCLDGGLLAALALRKIGYSARIIDLVPEPGIDDDHVLAIFKINGLYGAVAKSNFVGLRFREPVYSSLRELVMTYFDVFFNVDGIKTLRGYTRPINLDLYDRYNWQTELSGVDQVVDHLYGLKMVSVIKPATINLLNRMDPRSLEAGMMGVNMDGLYKPGKGH
ncbi:MAG: hypothetical protein CVU46_04485 [Chloroflexi bacterium HGW-Chloroflexi-8]|nr:MAG: hypothetical protein CVU46_04485 [Chloroflexi bacterium HGW-Chloroflexi-8]